MRTRWLCRSLKGFMTSVGLHLGAHCRSQLLPFPLVAACEGDVLPLRDPQDDLSGSLDDSLLGCLTETEAALADELAIRQLEVLDGSGVRKSQPVQGLIDRADLASLRIGVCVEDAPIMLFGSELDGSSDQEARCVFWCIRYAGATFEADG